MTRKTSYINGDCIESSKKDLQSDSIDLIITDPPYGINGDKLHKHYNRDESYVIDGYIEIPTSEYEDFSRKWLSEAERVLRTGGSMYLISGWSNLHKIFNALESTKLELINHIIWKYNFGVYTRQKYTTSHYHILYLVKPGAKPTFNTYSRFSASDKTGNNRSLVYADMEDVWIIDRKYKNGQIRHKNELPQELLIKMMQYSSNEGDVVADFFAGSFSTAKVAKGLNRSSISFEISEEACKHQIPLVRKVKWGELLEKVPQGKNDSPKRQYEPWDQNEIEKLTEFYVKYRRDGLTKKQSIANLQTKFQRGYFAILNAVKKEGLHHI
ncbi:site-specific DNA-methyltransferase [bacterium]|nr:site-specific DNA-methyltransferase [bacterium]